LSIKAYAYGGRCDTKGHRYGPVYTAFCLRDRSSGVDKHFEHLETLRDFVRKINLDARVDDWQSWQATEESYFILGTIGRPWAILAKKGQPQGIPSPGRSQGQPGRKNTHPVGLALTPGIQ